MQGEKGDIGNITTNITKYDKNLLIEDNLIISNRHIKNNFNTHYNHDENLLINTKKDIHISNIIKYLY